MAKEYEFTPPLDAPGNPTATAVAGGSLAVTTYYYRVQAVSSASISLFTTNSAQEGHVFGVPTAEFSVTTTSVNKSVELSWDAVAGAEAYIVYRWTVSGGHYNNSSRIRRITDNGTYNPTTTGTSMTDAGAYSLSSNGECNTYAGSLAVCGLPYTYWGGCLKMKGGTDIDPITPKNVYDWFVSNVTNYDRYIFYDGINMVLHFNVIFGYDATETHFKAVRRNIYFSMYTNIQSDVANSTVQFGDLNAQGIAIDGCRLYNIGQEYCRINCSTRSYLYATTVCGLYGDPDNTYTSPNGFGDARWTDYVNVEDSQDVRFEHIQLPTLYGTKASIGLQMFPVFYVQPYGNGFYTTWKLESVRNGDLYGTDSNRRYDEWTVYYPDYQIYADGTDGNYKVVNCNYPTSTDTEKFPLIYWSDNDTGTNINYYFDFVLKTTNVDGSAISGSNIIITDVNNNPGYDFDGTAITNFTSDDNGYIYREKINVTAQTDNTLTDSTKSWSTNQWLGRNVLNPVNGEKNKVISNTGTVLTFIKDWVSSPQTGDDVGIILELKRRLDEPTGTAGIDNTTSTDYAPLTLEVTSSGKKKYIRTFTPINKISWEITLDVGDTVFYDSIIYDSTIY